MLSRHSDVNLVEIVKDFVKEDDKALLIEDGGGLQSPSTKTKGSSVHSPLIRFRKLSLIASPTLMQNLLHNWVCSREHTKNIFVCSRLHNPLHFAVNFAVGLEMLLHLVSSMLIPVSTQVCALGWVLLGWEQAGVESNVSIWSEVLYVQRSNFVLNYIGFYAESSLQCLWDTFIFVTVLMSSVHPRRWVMMIFYLLICLVDSGKVYLVTQALQFGLILCGKI